MIESTPSSMLRPYAEMWRTKPVLRAVYGDFYDRLAAACVPGLTVEIGGGVGNLKERHPDVIATDIQFGPWLDCVADAQRLPFAAGAVSNIAMVDVLHHIEFPLVFFREAARALRPGGRVIMIEPAITWGSTLFYRLLHHEPVRMSEDPLAEGLPDAGRDPYSSNQAIPTLLATRDLRRFENLFPDLSVIRTDWFSFAAYPLSGGFKPWSLVSERLARQMLRIERKAERRAGRLLGFRMMIVIERIT